MSLGIENKSLLLAFPAMLPPLGASEEERDLAELMNELAEECGAQDAETASTAEHADTNLCALPCVHFVEPGLGKKTSDALFWTPATLPVTGAEARGLQRELIAMGERFGSVRDVAFFALSAETEDVMRKRQQDEEAALRAFIAQEKAENAGSDPAAKSQAQVRSEMLKNPLLEAQKVLLLARNLAEKAQELTSLQQNYEDVLNRMGKSLGIEVDAARNDIEENDISVSDVLKEFPGLENVPDMLAGSGNDVLALSWRVLLDALVAFLPENAVLLTDDADLRAKLMENGDAVLLSDAEVAELCPEWAQDANAVAQMSSLYSVSAPAWKILGHSAVPAERPWQSRVVRIVFAPLA